jgi:hypothetical protein
VLLRLVYENPKVSAAIAVGTAATWVGYEIDGIRSVIVAVIATTVVVMVLRRIDESAPAEAEPPRQAENKPGSIAERAAMLRLPAVTTDADDINCVPGGGWAVKDTPSDEMAIRVAVAYMRSHNEADFPGTPAEFLLPMGWTMGDDRPELMYTKLGTGADSILVTGTKNSGKDNAALWQTLTLLEQHTPDELQIVVMDTKGVDWGIFEGKAHTKSLFVGATQVKEAMAEITKEREQRKELLQQYAQSGIRKWSKLPPNRPPFLLIVITEIVLIIQEVGKAEAMRWLNAELVAWRAFGGYFIVVSQYVNNMDTGWRGQISLFMGAAQPRDVYDEPNTMFSTADIEEMGAVPPSKLPPVPANAGVFLVSSPSQRHVVNVRSSFISDEALVRIVDKLPNGSRREETRKPTEVDPWESRIAEIAAKNRAKDMSDDEIINHIIAKLRAESPNKPVTKRMIAVELWGYDGGSGPGSSAQRLPRLWETARQLVRDALKA